MGNPNSTNIAGFHPSDTLFPRMPLPSSEGRSNHFKTCMHALSMSWHNHNSALAYVARAMASINEARTRTARLLSRSNHRKTCLHARSRSWPNLIKRALDYVARAMEASLKYRQKRLDPSQNQIDTQNSTDKAGFNQSDMLFHELPAPSLKRQIKTTIIIPVCMHCSCRGKTPTGHETV